MVRKITRNENEQTTKPAPPPSFIPLKKKLMIFLLLFIISLLTIQLLTTHHYRKQKPNSDFDFNYFNYYLKHPPIVNEIPSELKTIMRPEQTRTSMMATDDEWLNAMRNNKVISVDFNMTKGYSNKYKVYLEGGYVAVAKPVMAIEETSAELPVVDFYQGLDYNKKNGQRTGLVDRRLTQGWSEIAAFHLDRILKFYRKPPITGRIFDNHFFFAFNDSEENMKYRNMKTFDYPMALVGWMDHVHSLYPTYENLGDILLMEVPINKSILSDLKSVSDTIVFDFLVDDHDKHNSQNWVGYVNKGEHFLLFWDSGLAWLHGPEGWDSCTSLLCGPKDWRDRIDGYNDTSCRPICRFNKKTVDNLRLFDNDLGFTLGALLEESLKSDPLFPVFTYGIYHAKIKNETAPKGKSTAYVHFLPENFFAGMDVKVKRFLNHVDQCIEQYGADEVFLPSSKKID